ncbi:hypothetical protein COLO4_25340 [Corchorus olitorius]|uniref:Uncharacterized protein n=1 Tax=Corchorus olitorius TaxID=93759 RepID=A0A1R3I3E3_9ROSI|nr:hypothetical protein COLO4_25340 [Corchorus olitorius]
MDKGLLKAVSENMPYVEARRCARHIYSRFEKNRTRSGKWEVEWNGADEHEVYIANVESGTRHSYAQRLYLKAYEHLLKAVKGHEFWPNEGEEVMPPAVKIVRGRRQTERRREEMEGPKGNGMPTIGRKMKCGICRKPGQNRSKCPSNHLQMGAASNDPPRQASSSQPNPATAKKQGKKPMHMVFECITPL